MDELHARMIEEDFGIEEGFRVFEITVGDSSLAARIADMHQEISILSLDLANPDAATAAPGKGPVTATTLRIPLPSGSYDRGFCYLTLARLGKTLAPAVLREVARVLKVGGRFRFAVADAESPAFAGAEPPHDLYTRHEIFELLEDRLGFQVVSMRRFNPDEPRWQDDAGSYLLFDIRNPERN